MLIFLIFFSLVAFIYCILLCFVYFGWIKNNLVLNTELSGNELFVSVIIPTRNEAKNILKCLQLLNLQSYRHFEIIVTDDESEDDTVAIAENFLKAHECGFVLAKDQLAFQDAPLFSPKKIAIEQAIARANGTIIAVLDADCFVLPDWLQTIVAAFKTFDAAMIVMPVRIEEQHFFLNHFEQMDLAGLIGITCGALFWKIPVMANGGNLAYKKNTFNALHGYEGNRNMPGGDDIMLLLKFFKAHPEKVIYLKDERVIATTFSATRFLDFFNQRLRWASKAGAFGEIKISIFMFLTFLFHLLLMVLFFLTIIYWNYLTLSVFLFFVALKFFIEYHIVRLSSHFLKHKFSFFLFLNSFLLYPVYVATIGFCSKLFSWEWKGRKHNG